MAKKASASKKKRATRKRASPKKSAPSVAAQIKTLEQAIDDDLRAGDPDAIKTSERHAGLQERLWSLRALLAKKVPEKLACSRESREWGTQKVRAAKSKMPDRIRELFKLAEQQRSQAGRFAGLK